MSSKVHDLTQIDAIAADDEFYVVDVSAVGASRARKASMSQIQTAGAASAAQARAMSSAAVNLTPANLAAMGVLTGLLVGMTLANNGSDATNDIDFAAGYCADSTGVAIIQAAAMTKQLDAAWAAGTNAGGLDTGSIANSTYHCFAIKKDSDGSGDFLFSTSATAPTMPSGYTYFRRIGSIIRSGGAILAFKQIGDRFERSTIAAPLQVNNPGTSAVTLTIGAVPDGIVLEALADVILADNTAAGATFLLWTSMDQTDVAPDVSHFTVSCGTAPSSLTSRVSQSMRLRTNTSRQVRYRLDNSTSDHFIYLCVSGWVDARGRI